jgi:hypothetical protein
MGIDSASAGDTVIIECGIYNEHDITLKSSIYLRSANSQPDCVTIDADSLGRVMFCENVTNVYIEGLTITGGYITSGAYGAGIRCINSSVTVENCMIIDNHTTGAGGGIDCLGHDQYNLIDCIVKNNTAKWGGGIDCGGSDPTITNCMISGNRSSNAGGGIICGGAQPNISNCIIVDNSTDGHGGAIYCDKSNPIIANCTFFNNITGSAKPDIYGCDNNSLNTFIEIINGPAFFHSYLWDNLSFRQNCSLTSNSTVESGTLDLRGGTISTMENIIMAFNRFVNAIYTYSDQDSAYLSCCNIYGNEGGDWIGSISDQVGVNGNFSLDPLFCDTISRNLHIDELSPCASNNNNCSSLIGALDIGCNITTVEHDSNAPFLPSNYLLYQNTPNPFNPVTEIGFLLPTASNVRIDIYNILGHMIETLMDRHLHAGDHSVIWNGSNYSTGLYLYKIEAGEFVDSKKMILLK